MARKVLHLGVVALPYRTQGLTTADVAGFLEDKYGVMSAFYRVHGKDVTKAVENSVEGALEALLMGQKIDPWARGMASIRQAFSYFITTGEAERVGIPGTPTMAAQRGVNHRFVHPYSSKNPRRVSFRDTGLYESSFRAWVDDGHP